MRGAVVVVGDRGDGEKILEPKKGIFQMIYQNIIEINW